MAIDGVEKVFSIVKVNNEYKDSICHIDGVVVNGVNIMPVAKATNTKLLKRLNEICEEKGSVIFDHCIRNDGTGALAKSRTENKSFYLTKIMPVNITKDGLTSNQIPCLTSDIENPRSWEFIKDEKNGRKFKKVATVGMVKFATDMNAVCDELLKRIGVE